MKAQRWFGRHAGEVLGSPAADVAAEVRRAGIAVRVLDAAQAAADRRRGRIVLVAGPDGTVGAVEVR